MTLSRGYPMGEAKQYQPPGEVNKMQHNLRISVTRQPDPGGVVAIRSVSVRERLLRFFLGEKRKLTILVPGDTVSGIEIQDVKDSDTEHEAVRDKCADAGPDGTAGA